MTEKTLTTENIKPALDALRGELAPWPVVAKKQDRLNDTQKSAVNSGITSSLVAQIIANTAAIRALESAITGTGLRALVVSSLPAIGTQGILYIVPVTTYDPATDADVVNYSNEYIWIPVEGGQVSEGHYEQVGQTGIVINNGQLTITVNGTSVGTFTANQSGDTTAAITVPTNADYVDRTTDQTVAGVKTFSSTIIGTAAKAIADEDGTSIKAGYVNVAGNQTVTGQKTWTGEQTFSQTIQGNAATASAFDTAKSITLTGAVTGTVSGTNSWEIATALKTGSAATGGTVTNPYFKIASWEVAPNDYFGTILQIQNKYYPYQIATLTIGLRTKTDATFQRGYSLLNNAIGIQSSAFILCYKEVTGKVLCELYYYTTTSFNGIRFSVISEGTRNDSSVFNTMVVYQNPAGIAALPSDYTTIQTSIGTYSQDFIPYSTNTYTLGSSTYQWASVYAQTYFYKGTAWGLDKNNVWTGYQTISSATNAVLQFQHGLSGTYSDIRVYDSAGSVYSAIRFKPSDVSFGLKYLGASSWYYGPAIVLNNDGCVQIKSCDGTEQRNIAFKNNVIYPSTSSVTDLGTSSLRWKSVYADSYYLGSTAFGNIVTHNTSEFATASHTHSASDITSGTIDIARLPQGALDRLITVADQTARYALTTNDISLGDTVKQLDTGELFIVTDVTNLNNSNGYTIYTAGIATKAYADEDGNTIKTSYGKLAHANTWTDDNTFSKNVLISRNETPKLLLKDTRNSRTYNNFSSGGVTRLETVDANDNPLSRISTTFRSDAGTVIEQALFTEDDSGNEVTRAICFVMDKNGNSSLRPYTDNVTNLGITSHRWRTLNGINPGALGIPDKDNMVNIASEFTDLTGGFNYYIPPVDGFVSINADTDVYCAVVSSTHNTAFWRQSAVATSTGYASVTIPVRAGLHLQAKINSTVAIYAAFYPCLGNV